MPRPMLVNGLNKRRSYEFRPLDKRVGVGAAKIQTFGILMADS